MESEYSSAALENAVAAFSRLPGIGRKTGLRLALHLLRRPVEDAESIGQAIIDLRRNIRYCRVCHNISEDEVCPVCSSPGRSSATVCVVETVRDVMSIEATGQYNGLYHVLGGVISPIDGVGPAQLELSSLAERVAEDNGIEEVILATSPTIEGDTTNYYISRLLSRLPRKIRLTQLARGVAVGNDIEYTDEATLARSILYRTPFEI